MLLQVVAPLLRRGQLWMKWRRMSLQEWSSSNYGRASLQECRPLMELEVARPEDSSRVEYTRVAMSGGIGMF